MSDKWILFAKQKPPEKYKGRYFDVKLQDGSTGDRACWMGTYWYCYSQWQSVEAWKYPNDWVEDAAN